MFGTGTAVSDIGLGDSRLGTMDAGRSGTLLSVVGPGDAGIGGIDVGMSTGINFAGHGRRVIGDLLPVGIMAIYFWRGSGNPLLPSVGMTTSSHGDWPVPLEAAPVGPVHGSFAGDTFS